MFTSVSYHFSRHALYICCFWSLARQTEETVACYWWSMALLSQEFTEMYVPNIDGCNKQRGDGLVAILCNTYSYLHEITVNSGYYVSVTKGDPK